jgi:hypothetical protein
MITTLDVVILDTIVVILGLALIVDFFGDKF